VVAPAAPDRPSDAAAATSDSRGSIGRGFTRRSRRRNKSRSRRRCGRVRSPCGPSAT
jgi:hypothetical protein